MADRPAATCALTALFPILPGDVNGRSHASALREYLATLRADVMARVDTTHMARWVVLDDPPFEGVPADEDHFASSYLLFVSDFDGSLDAYLVLLATALSKYLDAIYCHCVGFPGTSDVEAFATYVKQCQVATTFGFSAYPSTSVEDVIRAVASQRALVEFVDAHQHCDAASLQAAFSEFLDRLERAPLPAAGQV